MQTGEAFGAADYMAKTPSWAVIGSEERGFDPQETRHYRKKQVAKVTKDSTPESPPTR